MQPPIDPVAKGILYADLEQPNNKRFVICSCPFCGRFHGHGWPDVDETTSHRLSHCFEIQPQEYGIKIFGAADNIAKAKKLLRASTCRVKTRFLRQKARRQL